MTTKLYIGNLSESTTEQGLRELFDAFGPVSEVAVLQGFGFVHFRSTEDAQAARQALNETKFEGNSISVQISHTKGHGYRGGGGARGDRGDRDDRGSRGGGGGGRYGEPNRHSERSYDRSHDYKYDYSGTSRSRYHGDGSHDSERYGYRDYYEREGYPRRERSPVYSGRGDYYRDSHYDREPYRYPYREDPYARDRYRDYDRERSYRPRY